MSLPVPLHLRTKGNQVAWRAEILWVKKLTLQDRLSLRRDALKKEFLPFKPIRRKYPK